MPAPALSLSILRPEPQDYSLQQLRQDFWGCGRRVLISPAGEERNKRSQGRSFLTRKAKQEAIKLSHQRRQVQWQGGIFEGQFPVSGEGELFCARFSGPTTSRPDALSSSRQGSHARRGSTHPEKKLPWMRSSAPSTAQVKIVEQQAVFGPEGLGHCFVC